MGAGGAQRRPGSRPPGARAHTHTKVLITNPAATTLSAPTCTSRRRGFPAPELAGFHERNPQGAQGQESFVAVERVEGDVRRPE